MRKLFGNGGPEEPECFDGGFLGRGGEDEAKRSPDLRRDEVCGVLDDDGGRWGTRTLDPLGVSEML
jgi:hypothetical protein